MFKSLRKMSSTSASGVKSIEERLKIFNPTFLEVGGDTGACGAKIQIKIVSKTFENMKKIERHQKINEVFFEDLKEGKIHALSIKALTPEEHVFFL